MSGKANRRKRQRKLYRRAIEKARKDIGSDSVAIFWETLRLRTKFFPHDRDKIRLDPCAYCGSRDHDLKTVDHVKPKSRGGSNSLGNLVSSCVECNQAKADIDLLNFLLDRVAEA